MNKELRPDSVPAVLPDILTNLEYFGDNFIAEIFSDPVYLRRTLFPSPMEKYRRFTFFTVNGISRPSPDFVEFYINPPLLDGVSIGLWNEFPHQHHQSLKLTWGNSTGLKEVSYRNDKFILLLIPGREGRTISYQWRNKSEDSIGTGKNVPISPDLVISDEYTMLDNFSMEKDYLAFRFRGEGLNVMDMKLPMDSLSPDGHQGPNHSFTPSLSPSAQSPPG